MTSTNPHAIRSVRLAARVTTLLARTFPEAGPAEEEGFRVLSHDQREPRRMFVRWYGTEPTRPVWESGPELGIEGYRARIAETLVRAGYAVALPPDNWDVYVADRPLDPGPRYAAVPSDLPFGDQWLVMDQWTRVHAATAATEEEAKAEAMRLERVHALTDARLVTAPELWPHLERADALMGDGLTWLRREVHDVTRYSDIVRRERLDALVQVANALRAGREVVQSGRLVSWTEPEPLHPAVTYQVRWVPRSSAPAVGYFPFPEWERGPAEDQAITALIAGGLQPVVYGEPIDANGFMCERGGFMVTAAEPLDLRIPGIHITAIGSDGKEQQHRVPEVLTAAGWQVEADEDWPGAWTAFPPAG
ncbi:hypothetical protein ACPCSC_30230 [Streptomyces lavendulocolor]|uniref:hypothetical protein n=1 Tax=Streptomyces lavendulocolor TaxID=67316 RepID=UPI003C2FBEEB